LKRQYLEALNRFKSIKKEIRNNIKQYLARVSPKNPYLNKTISIGGKHLFYVTNQGVAKYIPDLRTLKSTNAPKKITPTNLQWSDSYLNPGTIIPTKPSLIVGTNVQQNQQFGNEGGNVFVNSMISSNPKANYEGCYQDNTSGSSTMTFIGGAAPPAAFAGLQNGNFAQPRISENTYYYYNSSSIVPGWNFDAVLINSSKAWVYPRPYPHTNQAVSIQNTQSISQSLQLSSGNYTLSFTACGRNCCDNSGVANPITIYLNSSSNANNQIYNFTPPIDSWTDYSTTFSVSTDGSYTLVFQGTWSSTDRSSAIQNIQLTQGSTTSSGTYTYDMCKQAAIQGGYQYFALQNVNPNTSLGYCGMTNNEPGAKFNGESYVPTKQITLWSSNTGGQTGNTATLNTSGSLSVLNSSGTSVFSTDNSQASPGNYLGCYGDRAKRAMPLQSGGSQQYSLSQCQQLAQQNGATYFGLQNSTSGTNAQCGLSSDWSQTIKYGKAGNCTKISDGSYSGGGWSNAVYNTNSTDGNYYLVLQDDGNMCIYRGTGPNDNQGSIWCSNTNGKAQKVNPLYVASNGKYGQNWIASGSTLAAGDFVGSNNGNMVLIMQSDGNLMLYTFDNTLNCSKMADGNQGGGQFANALYDLGTKGIFDNWGKMGFIDDQSTLYSYPDSNLQLSTDFTKITQYNSPGSDIGAVSGSTVDQCKTTCITNNDCYGFVFDISNNICYPKTSDMFPNSTGNPDSSSDLYVRQKSILKTPLGVKNTVKNIDTVTYSNYTQSGQNVGNSYGLPNINGSQKQELEQIQSTLQSLAQQITNLNGTFNENEILIDQQSDTNMQSLDQYLQEINQVQQQIKTFDGNYQNILNDSDIVVLQKNYEYMFWSILAVGSVLIAMNVMKK